MAFARLAALLVSFTGPAHQGDLAITKETPMWRGSNRALAMQVAKVDYRIQRF
jgi:hypothetical protein